MKEKLPSSTGDIYIFIVYIYNTYNTLIYVKHMVAILCIHAPWDGPSPGEFSRFSSTPSAPKPRLEKGAVSIRDQFSFRKTETGCWLEALQLLQNLMEPKLWRHDGRRPYHGWVCGKRWKNGGEGLDNLG